MSTKTGIKANSLLDAELTIKTREDLKALVTPAEYAEYEEAANRHRSGLMLVAVRSTGDGAWVGNLAL